MKLLVTVVSYIFIRNYFIRVLWGQAMIGLTQVLDSYIGLSSFNVENYGHSVGLNLHFNISQ